MSIAVLSISMSGLALATTISTTALWALPQADGRAIGDIAQQALVAQLSASYRDVQVRPVGKFPLPNCADPSLIATTVVGPLPVSSRMLATVRVRCEHTEQTLPLWFAVHAVGPVPVAARDLEAGSVLAEGDYVMGEADLASMRAHPSDSGFASSRWRIRVPVRKDDLLIGSAIERAPPVMAGEEVIATLADGVLHVDLRARALQDGRVGATVRVRNASSGGEFPATVTGVGRVEVQP
jgi:flagella basal body P-ring formation protein FlgA